MSHHVTDDGGANPWDRLPTYWQEEVAAVRERNLASRWEQSGPAQFAD
jgi:hypothetical protein